MLTRITLVGAVYLASVAVLPDLLITGFRVDALPFVGEQLDAFARSNPVTGSLVDGMGVTFYFGGTSLLIIVGVSMDTVNQVESQLIMRHYDGFMGAVYLASVAVLPDLLITGFRVDALPFVGEQLDAFARSNPVTGSLVDGMGVTFYFGGTSLLIIVGVSMDTVNQVESQLIMRHYDGFMKKTRIKGRRG